MATVNEVKLMNNGEMVTPVPLAGSVKNLDGSSTIDGLMKKVADSDLNMNGNSINKVLTLQSNRLGGSDNSKISIPPVYTIDNIGLTGSSTFSQRVRATLKKICEDFPNHYYDIFICRCAFQGNGTFITMINNTNSLDEEGYPKYTQGMYMRDNGEMYAVNTYSGKYTLSLLSGFDSANTALDNRVNSMGSNYIRYENGLQICWGTANLTVGANTSSITNGSTVYYGAYSVTFPVTFLTGTVPSATVTPNRKLPGLPTVSVEFLTNTALTGFCSSPTQGDMSVNYVAIGKWK